MRDDPFVGREISILGEAGNFVYSERERIGVSQI